MSKPYDIEYAFSAIEDELIESMMRNMKRHRAEEDDEGILWEMWQAKQLEALERYKKANKEKFSGRFSDINNEIEELIREANKKGYMDQEVEILKAIKSGFKGYKKSSSTLQAEFFKLNERKLEALISATVNDMQQAETAILRMADDQYRKIIYNAQVYANTGAGTYEQAVDMAAKDMLRSGLNCVEYANSARHTLRDYADMAIRTASKRAYLQGEGTKRQEWGIFTVVMNKRGNPCPKCLPFCGKVLIDDVWSGGPADGISPETGKRYPLMSKAIEAGLYHPRCKDSHTTYFEGLDDEPDDSYTKKELKDVEKQYAKEQVQQYAKRQAEKFGRLEKYSLDEENRSHYKNKAKEWDEKYSALNKNIFDKMALSISDDIYKAKGMTPEVKAEIENAIEKLQKEYEIHLSSIEVGDIGNAIFAAGPYADEDGALRFGLVINENIDYNEIRQKIMKRYKLGKFAGKSLEDYIAHEMAHIMTYQECKTVNEYYTRTKIIKKQFIKGISGYADITQDGAESLAEAFVKYRNGDKMPRNAEVLVRTYIERWKK